MAPGSADGRKGEQASIGFFVGSTASADRCATPSLDSTVCNGLGGDIGFDPLSRHSTIPP